MELAMCFMLGLGGYGYVGAMWNSLYVYTHTGNWRVSTQTLKWFSASSLRRGPWVPPVPDWSRTPGSRGQTGWPGSGSSRNAQTGLKCSGGVRRRPHLCRRLWQVAR